MGSTARWWEIVAQGFACCPQPLANLLDSNSFTPQSKSSGTHVSRLSSGDHDSRKAWARCDSASGTRAVVSPSGTTSRRNSGLSSRTWSVVVERARARRLRRYAGLHADLGGGLEPLPVATELKSAEVLEGERVGLDGGDVSRRLLGQEARMSELPESCAVADLREPREHGIGPHVVRGEDQIPRARVFAGGQ